MQVYIFQNSNYSDVSPIVNKWQNDPSVTNLLKIEYIQSKLPTGYYGRFLVPLLSKGLYWAVFDDDIIFGARYVCRQLYECRYIDSLIHECVYIIHRRTNPFYTVYLDACWFVGL
jgi:hypothetical protein